MIRPPDTRHDHREIARDMKIFTTDPAVGSGLPIWLPAGAIIRRELEQYAHEIALATGCQAIYSPVLGKRSLYERSGHWAKFHDDMFPPMSSGGDELVLRPANCPHHALAYAAEQHSHRDLPVRFNELAAMFRSERSGVLAGLSRVRQINLDDTHVFCRPDQIRAEVALALSAVLDAFEVLGIEIAYVRLSARDDSPTYLGSTEQWDDAEAQLRRVLDELDLGSRGIGWREVAGEAAFYGPKLDVQVVDARGQEESLSTVQLDFNQPERFDLTYVAAGGSRRRVVMIHRGLLGGMERMVAFLLERYDGRLPLWLAPMQLCLLPVGPDQVGPAEQLADEVSHEGLRVRVDPDGSLGARIRTSRLRRDALLGVLGEREVAAAELAVHDPASDQRRTVSVPDLIAWMQDAVRRRSQRPSLPDGRSSH